MTTAVMMSNSASSALSIKSLFSLDTTLGLLPVQNYPIDLEIALHEKNTVKTTVLARAV